MRARTLCTLSRLRVRRMFRSFAFPLARPLPSIPSARGAPPSLVALGAPWPSPAFPPACPFRFAMAACSSFSRSLFGSFVGTMGQSDSLLRSSMDYVLRRPTTAHRILYGRRQGLPVLAQSVSTHARGLRPRQAPPHLALAVCRVLPSESGTTSAPGTETYFRGSIPGLRVPLLTLRARPLGRVHIARGHRGWLALQCTNPSFAALCRFIPALLRNE